MLGSCFLSLLQVQAQFLMSSADLTASLGGFHEIGDYLRDREVTLALKDATATWISLAQVCTCNQCVYASHTKLKEGAGPFQCAL